MFRICAMLSMGMLMLAPTLSLGDNPLEIGKTVRDLPASGWISGEPIQIESGRYYLIYGWAAWCKPCVDQLEPTMKWCEKQSEAQITMIAISIGDRSKECARQKAYLAEEGLSLPAVCNPSIRDEFGFGVNGQIPFFALIDDNRKILSLGHPPDILDRSLTEIIQFPEPTEEAIKLIEQLEASRSFKDSELELGLLKRLASIDVSLVKYGADRIRLLSKNSSSVSAAWEYANELFDLYGYRQAVMDATLESITLGNSGKNPQDAVKMLDSLLDRQGDFVKVGAPSYSFRCRSGAFDEETLHEFGETVRKQINDDPDLLLEFTLLVIECGKPDRTLISDCIEGLRRRLKGPALVPILTKAARISFDAGEIDPAIAYQEEAIQSNNDAKMIGDLQTTLTYYQAKRDAQDR